MPSIPGLRAIPAGNPGVLTGDGNWTYLLTGRVPTLIDAGVGRDAHVEAIAAVLDAAGQHLQQIVVTHDHADHSSGTTALLTRWPQATCLKFPSPVERPHTTRWTPLQNSQTIAAGDEHLVVVHTPGHAADHICLWHEPSRTLFGGDLLVDGGTVVVPGGRGGNLREYLDSLDRVAALAPVVVLPAHGEVISAPAALIASYHAHRGWRERQIIDAIRSGADSVTAIVDRVYSDLTSGRRSVAAETVRAHLAKLREEGRIVESEGRVRLIG
jgi:glyoxylase-like metal-dependent hydrolase (beta-lactamase superfamily II)